MNKKLLSIIFLFIVCLAYADFLQDTDLTDEFPLNYTFNYSLNISQQGEVSLVHCICSTQNCSEAISCINKKGNNSINLTYLLNNKEKDRNNNTINASDFVFEYIYLNKSYSPIYNEHIFNWTLANSTVYYNITFVRNNSCFSKISSNIEQNVPPGKPVNITYIISSVYESKFNSTYFQPAGKESEFSNLINSSIWIDKKLVFNSSQNLTWGQNKTFTYIHPGFSEGGHNITIMSDPTIDEECTGKINLQQINYTSMQLNAFDINLTRPELLIINMSLNFTGPAQGCGISEINNGTIFKNCTCVNGECFVEILPGKENISGKYFINSTIQLTANFTINITEIKNCSEENIQIVIADNPMCSNNTPNTITLRDSTATRRNNVFSKYLYSTITIDNNSKLSDQGGTTFSREINSIQPTFKLGKSVTSYQFAVFCNKTGKHKIRFNINSGQYACFREQEFNINKWNINHISSNITSLPKVLVIGKNYSFNYSLINDGTNNLSNVEYLINYRNGKNFLKVTNGSSGLIETDSTWVKKIYFTPTAPGNSSLKDTINFGSGEYDNHFYEFYINHNPTIKLENISEIWSVNPSDNNYTITYNLKEIYSDNDTYDNCTNIVWNYNNYGNNNISVLIKNCTLNITILNKWIGNQNLTLSINDTYNATISKTISLNFKKVEISHKKNKKRKTRIISNLEMTPIDKETFGEKKEEKESKDDIQKVTKNKKKKKEKEIKPNLEQPAPPALSKQKKIESFVLKQLNSGSISHKRKSEFVEGNTRITETFKNLNLYKKNISIILDFPKDVVKKAEEINSQNNFVIIKDDPIIQFNLLVDSYDEKYIQYTLKNKLSEEELKRIIVNITEYNTEIENITRIIERTKKAVNISQSYFNEDNKTTFNIDIDIKKKGFLGDVSVFQEIPKCLIEVINKQMIKSENKDFEIINADPLIVWHFDNILDIKRIQYTIDASADENCTNKVATLALAKEIILVKKSSEINYKNLWITLAIIPLIVLLFVGYGFLVQKKEHEDEEKNKLTQYIRNHYRNGYSKIEVRNKLLYEGYPDYEIDECLNLHTKHHLQFLLHKLEIGFDELILGILIILNILDFTELGTILKLNYGSSFFLGDIDYIKKIISWALLGYLLYRVSITKVLFGKRKPFLDITLITTFFLFTFKNIISYAKVAWQSVDITLDLYSYLINNNVFFEKTLFSIGILILVFISFIINDIDKKSLLGNFNIKNPIKRGVLVFLTLNVFFVVVFNLMMEWLAIAVDAFILVITLLVIIYIIFKHRHKITTKKVIEETSSAPEKFYESFINLFHNKKTLFLGISGMLILHALTEIGNFLVPYIMGVKDEIYFGNFNINHQALFFGKGNIFMLQTSGLNVITKLGVIITYFGNIVALLILFSLPALLWKNYYVNRNKAIKDVSYFEFSESKIKTSIIGGIIGFSTTLLLLNPLFKIKSLIGSDNLAGVDILTQPISLEKMWIFLGIATIIGLIILISTFFKKSITNIVILPISLMFFTYYILLFAISINIYNFKQILVSRQFISYYGFCLGIISTFVLYFIGYIIVLYMYIPINAKDFFARLPIINQVLVGHKHQYIAESEYEYNKEDINKIAEHIKKSGFNDFEYIENLIKNNLTIEEIIKKVKRSNLIDERKTYLIIFYFNNKEQIDNLVQKILQLKIKYDLETIRKGFLDKGWPKHIIDTAILALNSKN